MKNIFTICLMLAVCITGENYMQAQGAAPQNSEVVTSRKCGTKENEQYLRSEDPLYDVKKEDVMKTVAAKVKEREDAIKNGTPHPYAQYTIPIVVHVLWNTTAENVSDAKVTAMISQINMDWSHTNTDAGNTPAVWQPITADMQIQFCLATKDPSGAATTGIVHKQTSITDFSSSGNPKYSAQGGDDAWDFNKYLNVWVADIGNGLFGYANFPPASASYGTVLNYCTVGSLTNPGLCGAFGYGRTLSHEIGHNFTLEHIWGDEPNCAQDDGVADTPKQADASSGCPSFPHTDVCSPSSPGIMYMNYMDYSDDMCYNMFTNGQKNLCQSTIASYLMSLVNSAATVCGVTDVNTISPADIISLYPNPSTGEVFITAELSNINTVDFKVYNSIGEVVLSKKTNTTSSRETKVDLSNNPDGIYLFQVKTSEGMITKKIVINR